MTASEVARRFGPKAVRFRRLFPYWSSVTPWPRVDSMARSGSGRKEHNPIQDRTTGAYSPTTSALLGQYLEARVGIGNRTGKLQCSDRNSLYLHSVTVA